MRLARDGVLPIYGVNYKDEPSDARRWLSDLGDPYQTIGADRPGRTAIEWGVYGIPETFIVDAEGRIRHREPGALTPKSLREIILPLVRDLRAEQAAK